MPTPGPVLKEQSRPTDETSQALLIVVSAPSGAGKTTLCNQLLSSRSDMTRAITCTTRAPRAGEQDGVDYYFLDVATFDQRARRGEFLEHANVFGNRYGTLKAEVFDKLRQGRDVLLNIDVQGAATIRRCADEDEELRRVLVTIFLTTPSFAVLEARLKKRGTDAPEVVAKRLAAARQEMAQWNQFDYLLISGTVAEDLRKAQVIVESEKMRSARSVPPQL